MPQNEIEVHDPEIMAQARRVLDACRSAQEMQQAVLDAVARNEEWRGQRCINLLAPEAPTSPTARALLSSEVGIRAAEGHIGAVNRWFVGTQYIDEMPFQTMYYCFDNGLPPRGASDATTNG